MKKITLILLFLILALGASGGYGYFIIFNDNDNNQDTEENSNSNSYPIARISPSNPKIQANETIVFSASDSTDPDGDDLSFTWTFEGDSMQYEGETVERKYDEGGSYSVMLSVIDSTGLTDEAETTVNVVEDYHAEASGDVDDGETDEVEFPVQSGAISVYIAWSLDDNNQITGNIDPSTVNLILKDAQGNNIENETAVQEGDGSWSIDSERLESVGDYDFVIEGENGSMSYEVTIDVSY